MATSTTRFSSNSLVRFVRCFIFNSCLPFFGDFKWNSRRLGSLGVVSFSSTNSAPFSASILTNNASDKTNLFFYPPPLTFLLLKQKCVRLSFFIDFNVDLNQRFSTKMFPRNTRNFEYESDRVHFHSSALLEYRTGEIR